MPSPLHSHIVFSFSGHFYQGFCVWRRCTRHNVNSIISSVGPLRYKQHMRIIYFYYLHSPWHSVVLSHTDGYTLCPFPQKHARYKCQVMHFTCPLIPSNWVSLLWKTQAHYIWIVECLFSTISWPESSSRCSTMRHFPTFLCLVTVHSGNGSADPDTKYRLFLQHCETFTDIWYYIKSWRFSFK